MPSASPRGPPAASAERSTATASDSWCAPWLVRCSSLQAGGGGGARRGGPGPASTQRATRRSTLRRASQHEGRQEKEGRTLKKQGQPAGDRGCGWAALPEVQHAQPSLANTRERCQAPERMRRARLRAHPALQHPSAGGGGRRAHLRCRRAASSAFTRSLKASSLADRSRRSCTVISAADGMRTLLRVEFSTRKILSKPLRAEGSGGATQAASPPAQQAWDPACPPACGPGPDPPACAAVSCSACRRSCCRCCCSARSRASLSRPLKCSACRQGPRWWVAGGGAGCAAASRPANHKACAHQSREAGTAALRTTTIKRAALSGDRRPRPLARAATCSASCRRAAATSVRPASASARAAASCAATCCPAVSSRRASTTASASACLQLGCARGDYSGCRVSAEAGCGSFQQGRQKHCAR